MTAPDLDALLKRLAALVGQEWARAELVGLEPLEGGHSGLTLVATLSGAPQEVERLVVKIAPPGRPAVGRHDVLRQARLLSGLAETPGVRVPRVLLRDRDEPQLFAMTYVDGEAVEPILDAPDVVRAPQLVATRAHTASRMLAAVHAARPEALVANEASTTLLDELERWQPTMARIDPDLRPRAPQLVELLGAALPRAVPPAILHGDYRLGNILCLEGDVRGIIDWEIWSVGDPRIDLGWFLVFTDAGNLPGAAEQVDGMPPADDLVADYEQVSGAPLRDMTWFHALARYKMAAIMGHNLQRHREGRYHDPYQERLPASILSLVDQGIALLA